MGAVTPSCSYIFAYVCLKLSDFLFNITQCLFKTSLFKTMTDTDSDCTTYHYKITLTDSKHHIWVADINTHIKHLIKIQ